MTTPSSPRAPLITYGFVLVLLASVGLNVVLLTRRSAAAASEPQRPASRSRAELEPSPQDLASAAAAPAARAAAPVVSVEEAKPKGTIDSVVAAIANDKNRKRLTLAKYAETRSEYADFFRATHLPLEKIQRLRMIIAERGVISSAVFAYGPDLEQADREAIAKQYSSQYDAGINALIGPQAASQLKEYEKMQPARYVTDRWTEQISYLADPLSFDQKSALTRLVADKPPPGYPMSQDAASVAQYFDRKHAYQQELLNAVGFLTTSQRTALQAAFEEDNTLEAPVN